MLPSPTCQPKKKTHARSFSLIESDGRMRIGLAGDMLNSEYRNSLDDRAAEKLGGLDILVKNAGKQISVEKLEELSDDQIM